MRRASGVADRVFVYTYGGRGADLWWKQNATELARLANLTVVNLPYESTQALAKLAQRNMKLDCTIQEGQVWLSDGAESVAVEPQVGEVVAPARRWVSSRDGCRTCDRRERFDRGANHEPAPRIR